ncbi:MAG: 1-acyl-sn-glycerol-3-phosphate acyltransferase [Mycetocola sp.]|jgi:1-acyl-sn-glycerol-3-phosphate acyltransferase|nr:1-acyl-sn-glycerol-3-phosphate acyltransferase [Mycetocola sp.]MCU1561356.1 1-acyl-sn-glycerol-3-phosphate acyltransferase [Mycetocola sp.]
MAVSETEKRRRASPEKTRPSIYWLLACIALPPARLMMKIRIQDRHKLPVSGPFVLAPNHFSEIDPIVIGIAVWKMGRAPRFMAKAGLFTVPVVGWLLTKSGQIPVKRAGSTRDSDPVQAGGLLVEKGQGVVIYPEGSLTRDPDLWPMRGKTGAVRVALTNGIPIIPIAHWGTDKVMARYSRKINLFPAKPIDVKVGDPVDLSAFAGRPLDAATLAEATAVVMKEITALLEDLRGEKAPDELWDPSKHNQKDTGRF